MRGESFEAFGGFSHPFPPGRHHDGPEGPGAHEGFGGHGHGAPGGGFGGHRGPDGPAGHGHGRRGGRARRGEFKYLLMDALQRGPKHGYEIIKSLEERAGGRWTPSPGVVYPTLQFLSEAGQIESEQEGDRRVYRLTESGQTELGEHAAEVAEFWAQFAPPSSGSARAEIVFVEEEIEYLARAVRGALRGDPDTALVRSVRQAIENCRGEVRRLIAESEGGS